MKEPGRKENLKHEMKEQVKPDFLFEVSWEVCNKVGGINTVIATKARNLVNRFNSQYILIGPDIYKDPAQQATFIEEPRLYHQWVEQAREAGFRIRIGRWNIAGSPVVILIDFTGLFDKKDLVFKELWEDFGLDSLYGGWDYIEPALFGYESARLIEHFYDYNISAQDNIIAHFHEWITGTGILYLRKKTPQVATVFTTHATVLGRSIAGNHLPLYSGLENFQPEAMARQFNVLSKYSLESLAAKNADAFSTVSEITAAECKYLLRNEVDLITPNGFESSFIPVGDNLTKIREHSRELILKAFQALSPLGNPSDSLLLITSGRYEFKNKGIDLFIRSLGELNKKPDLAKNVLACIAVPAGNHGVDPDIYKAFNEGSLTTKPRLSTHLLSDTENDPVLKFCAECGLDNRAENKVRIMFVPSYLDGNDGLFNIPYYDFLSAFDLSVFASYYEPWGYTPLESIAFGIPTITTSLAGFGLWARSAGSDQADTVTVINRDDYNENDVIAQITDTVSSFSHFDAHHLAEIGRSASSLATKALWDNFVTCYYELFDKALQQSLGRYESYRNKKIIDFQTIALPQKIDTNWRKVFILPNYPEALKPLLELVKNLWWTWDAEASALIQSIRPDYWAKSGQNPMAMLEMMRYDELEALAANPSFIAKINDVYDRFCEYMKEDIYAKSPLTAYFCMEYGIHNSLKIFSGGLGILAGDYLKEASDYGYPIVGIGLLYRYGYFRQKISPFGEQVADYIPQKFSQLPIYAVRDENGKWRKIVLEFPGRKVWAKIWQVNVGRVRLYLMDTDIEENSPEDRNITAKLYDANWEVRFQQELLLGFGGVKILNTLGIHPDLVHLNEGHAAFSAIERIRNLMQNEKLSFYQGLEVVKASTLFTTHTPVPAGHDKFNENLLRTYLAHFPEILNITWDEFCDFGRENEAQHEFSVSLLALRTSCQTNGVSAIHGRVTREMFSHLYPGYFTHELFIGHVTNGVHSPTWMTSEWKNLFSSHLGHDFLRNICEEDTWEKLKNIPDEEIFNMKKMHKRRLIDYLLNRLSRDMSRRQELPSFIVNTLDILSESENALIIGFARRFATYKRAGLLFKDIERLKKMVNDPVRPVRFIFSGKAHPSDGGGQDIIRRIIEISKLPDFVGKIIFIENYDAEIARLMVSGVDIWLNNPTRPLEASGTSGMKAIMNGTLNLSVLDGWWAEGYIPGAGWALKEESSYEDDALQNELDAVTIYNLLEDDIIPLYYKRNSKDIPCEWTAYIRKSFERVVPSFSTIRMLREYIGKYYNPLYTRSTTLLADHFAKVKELSLWKRKLLRNWENIEIENVTFHDSTQSPLLLGEEFTAGMTVNLRELSPEDVSIELLITQKQNDRIDNIILSQELFPQTVENGKVIFGTHFKANQPGVFDFAFRMKPRHPLLPHDQDFNLVKWI